MIFNSVEYLLYFPIVAVLYFLLPQKLRNYWLLAASFFFYMSWNKAYGLLLAGSILVTYLAALATEGCRSKGNEKGAKAAMLASLFLNLGALAWFKYLGFLGQNVNFLLGLMGKEAITIPDILLPVGISFYIFQALGYALDVYFGKIRAEKNLFTYALFVSFFPQLVAGPIERSRNLLPQFYEEHTFEVARVKRGLLMMLWGLFMKMVIADRLSLIVTGVYGEYLAYNGFELFLATALFCIQIYCDFAGYSYLAIGSAGVLGFRLMDNFKQPFLTTSIHGHWSRWHISLTGWFRDYLYIPLGGNRKGKARKLFNTMVIFLVSGLWHGARWNYVTWGALHGAYMVIEELLGIGVRKKDAKQKTETAEEESGKQSSGKVGEVLWAIARGVFTYLLITFGFLIFRSETMSQVVGILRQAKANPGLGQITASFSHLAGLGNLDPVALVFFVAAILLLLLVDLYEKPGRDMKAFVLAKPKVLRWCVYLGLLLWILLFGIYGHDYTQTEFIYFQF